MINTSLSAFYLKQDFHDCDEVIDNAEDMDSLNRNIPECGRQTHQVLQVSYLHHAPTKRANIVIVIHH